jgi:hypothetical protein
MSGKPSAPIAEEVSAPTLPTLEESSVIAEAPSAPLVDPVSLPNGVTLPPGFIPPPGFDASAYQPVEIPAPVIPSVEDLMAAGESAVAAAQDSGTNGFEAWLNNPTFDEPEETLEVPESLPEASATPGTKAETKAETASYDLEDPLFVQSAAEMGVTPAQLAELLGPPEVTTQEVETPAVPAIELSPNEAALQARLEQMEAQFAQLKEAQEAEAQAQALAQQEADMAASRAEYEATQRAEYEAQFEYLDDETRDAVISAKLEADMLRWDSQSARAQLQAQIQAQQDATLASQRDAAYSASVEAMTKANPTMGIEIAPDYRLADFVADTHRAACDAYGVDAVGDFSGYSEAFAKAIQAVQTKAVRHGITLAQAKLAKGAGAPPALGNKGGSAPATKPPTTSDAIRPGSNQLFAHLRSPQTRR